MEILTSVFRQGRRLRSQRSNETKAGSSNEHTNAYSNGHLNGRSNVHSNGSQLNANKKTILNNQTKLNNCTITQLRPRVENEFLEFADRYEINLTCALFQKNDMTIKYNENDNQLKIIGFQSKKLGEKIVINRKILRCFNLPQDVCSDKITSVYKNSQLKIRIPKYKKIIDGNSDGESCYECTECEESSDLSN